MAVQNVYNLLEGKYATTNMIDEINSGFTTVSDTVKQLEEKYERLEKCFSVFESAFNNNMRNLAKHLESHKAFETHLSEVEKRIEDYVTQQLNNSRILQAYVEKELFLSSLANEICYAQINALAEAPWWKKLTKKKRSYIMLKAKVETQDKYAKHLGELNERLSKITKETLKNETGAKS